MFRLSSTTALLSFLIILVASPAVFAQSTNRDQAITEIDALRAQIKAREKVLLAPSEEDRLAYAEFLQQPDTGLIRLLPREKYDGKLTVRGGGSYYSFHKLTHEYGDPSDIGLEQNSFLVGFHGADFGYFCVLGDVPLETVTLDHAGVQFLATYAPPSIEAEVRKVASRAYLDMRVGDFVYKNRVPVTTNTTYLLRSISFGDADSLVAFRVIRQDADGSVILLWKMLKRFPTPQLVRDKTAKL